MGDIWVFEFKSICVQHKLNCRIGCCVVRCEMSESYDTIPKDRWGDARWIWEQQISGRKNFDSFSFMGTLNDLQGDPNWRSIFDPVKNTEGMTEFLDRLQGHFDLCSAPNNADGSFTVYQHPTRTKRNRKINKKAMIELTRRIINTAIAGFKLSDEPDDAQKLSQIPVIWSDDSSHHFQLTFSKQQENRNGLPLGLSLGEAWEFEIWNEEYFLKSGSVLGNDLDEAVYSLANDPALERYLLQSFQVHDLDVDAQYELEWINNCIFYFDETTCYVTQRPE